jgi:trimeric autotransporter adhesin
MQVTSLRTILRFSTILVSLLAWTAAFAQTTPLGDSYINTNSPAKNFGAQSLLDVDGATQITYIQFNLASIPANASISQATLKLYVNSVAKAGSFNVDYVNGSWTESTIDAGNAPPLGTNIASNVNVTAADQNQYILVNVTSAVQAWLSGSETNNGIALVANSTFNATFDSKESTTTSHPPELDIAFPGGTIEGVTTPSGSGLTGGGTNGTLNLSLTNVCAISQVLQWNGSAWTCASAGTGTITAVTAGTDLTGGGTSGNVTLNLNTSALNATYAQLSATNTFTGNQTVNGNLTATGAVTGGSYQIGSNLFAFGSYTSSSTFVGFAGNASSSGYYNTGSGAGALGFNTTGYFNTAIGVAALGANTTGGYNTAAGGGALIGNTTGSDNTAVGYSALQDNSTGVVNTAIGESALVSNGTGNDNTASGFFALANSNGSYNTASGAVSLGYNTSGTNNTATGYDALSSNTTSSYNTASGSGALFANTTGGPNEAFGYEALYNNNGSNGQAFGYQALYSNTGGAGNQAFGYRTLFSNTNGSDNAAFGGEALYANTTGAENTAVGGSALYANTTGSFNTAVGQGALVGNTTGDSLTCIGFACTADPGIRNATAIGAHARVEQSNSLVLGSAGINVGIGTTQPSNILTVARGAGHPVSDSWETYSSRRWKTNIHPLQDALGKVEQLRGVSYDRKDSGKHEIGVIAEEVGQIVPEVVSYEKNGKDAAGVDYSRLTALLIEAVKQQQVQILGQQKQIALQQSQIRKQHRLARAQQQQITNLRKLTNTQQNGMAGLTRRVRILESGAGTTHEATAAVLASR